MKHVFIINIFQEIVASTDRDAGHGGVPVSGDAVGGFVHSAVAAAGVDADLFQAKRGRETMKHVFIINPTAGKNDCTAELMSMAKGLAAGHGLDVDCILTKRPGHAMETARNLAQSGEEIRVYACGGDPEGGVGVTPCGTEKLYLFLR